MALDSSSTGQLDGEYEQALHALVKLDEGCEQALHAFIDEFWTLLWHAEDAGHPDQNRFVVPPI
jgi:hypothetical protein